MTSSPRLGLVVGSAAVTLALAACGSQVALDPGATAPPPSGTVAPPDTAVSDVPGAGGGSDPEPETTISLPPGARPPASKPFETRAAQVAAQWRSLGLVDRWRSGLVALAPLTTDPGGFEDSEAKSAYLNGWVRVSATLPPAPEPTRTVTVGGASTTLTLVGATRALEDAFPGRSDDCSGQSGCVPLQVTGARLTSTTVLTNRGPAQLPAWAFTLAGVDEPVLRVAVAPEDLRTDAFDGVPGADGATYAGVAASQELVSVAASGSGSAVAYSVGVGACDVDITPRVLETDDVVVVGATYRTEGEVCNDMLKIQPVIVITDEPVGSRPVVDAMTGMPLVPRDFPR